MHQVSEQLLDTSSEYEALVLEALRASAQIDGALESSATKFALSGRWLAAFSDGVAELNMILTELGLRSHQHVALFNYTIKNHALEHIRLQASMVSPRLSWCYPQESFLQHVRRLVGSVRMQPTLKLQSEAMARYLRLF